MDAGLDVGRANLLGFRLLLLLCLADELFVLGELIWREVGERRCRGEEFFGVAVQVRGRFALHQR